MVKTFNVIFFCNWGHSSEDLLKMYNLMTNTNSGIWNNLKGVTNLTNADIVIFIEGIPHGFNINLVKSKIVICFPREPLIKIKNWEVYKFLYGFTYSKFYHVVTDPRFINKDYSFLSDLKYQPHENQFSAIISNKNNGNGYQLRRNLLINLSKKYPNLCDIYGHGWNNELGVSYKGPLGCYHNINRNNCQSKYDALINYKYSLCIENCSISNYFSEKFTDSILCWCIPIYFGCTNIEKYFPKGSFYQIDITKPECIDDIANIIKTPISDNNIVALKKARELVLNKYNIWETINTVISY